MDELLTIFKNDFENLKKETKRNSKLHEQIKTALLKIRTLKLLDKGSLSRFVIEKESQILSTLILLCDEKESYSLISLNLILTIISKKLFDRGSIEMILDCFQRIIVHQQTNHKQPKVKLKLLQGFVVLYTNYSDYFYGNKLCQILESIFFIHSLNYTLLRSTSEAVLRQFCSLIFENSFISKKQNTKNNLQTKYNEGNETKYEKRKKKEKEKEKKITKY